MAANIPPEREQKVIRLFAKAIISSPVANAEQKALATSLLHETNCRLRELKGI